jgi:hemerythrin-like domain-containing protein
MSNKISDAALTDELAGLIDRLRMPGYGRVAGGLDQAVEGSIEAFADLLAKHLLYEEQVLFPILKEAAPDHVGDVLGLAHEHRDLRDRVRELAEYVKAGDRTGACTVGRAFLAALYGHVRREEEVTRRITDGVTGNAAFRLQAILEQEVRSLDSEDLWANDGDLP